MMDMDWLDWYDKARADYLKGNISEEVWLADCEMILEKLLSRNQEILRRMQNEWREDIDA